MAPGAGSILQLHAGGGGVPKHPIDHAIVGLLGIDGDRQAWHHHGGPDKALCLWSAEVIRALCEEGHRLHPGAAGENVTVAGLDWATVTPGVRLGLGAHVEVEVTGYAVPCRKNARWFRHGETWRMGQRRAPGRARVYVRVLSVGVLRPGDAVVLGAATAGNVDAFVSGSTSPVGAPTALSGGPH